MSIEFNDIIDSSKIDENTGKSEIVEIFQSILSQSILDDMKNHPEDLTDDIVRRYLKLHGANDLFFNVLFELTKHICVSEGNPFLFETQSLKILAVIALYLNGKFEVFGDG